MKLKSEFQYRHTQEQVKQFEKLLANFDGRPEAHPGVHPRLIQATKECLASEIESLNAQLADYERRQWKKLRPYSLKILKEVPNALVRARIASGLTQAALAEKIGLKPQQIQRYESTKYAHASLARIQQIAQAIEAAAQQT